MIEALMTLGMILVVAICFTIAMVGGLWFGWNLVNVLSGGELNRIIGGK